MTKAKQPPQSPETTLADNKNVRAAIQALTLVIQDLAKNGDFEGAKFFQGKIIMPIYEKIQESKDAAAPPVERVVTPILPSREMHRATTAQGE